MLYNPVNDIYYFVAGVCFIQYDAVTLLDLVLCFPLLCIVMNYDTIAIVQHGNILQKKKFYGPIYRQHSFTYSQADIYSNS